MDREGLVTLISEKYGAEPETLWLQYPNYLVFRHDNNQKWFAIIMDITKDKIGLDSADPIDVVDFKCDTRVIDTARAQKGVYPGYHMNKANWVSVALDGSAEDEVIKALLDESFILTAGKMKKAKNHPED